jgi:BTB/POZ domain
VGAAITVLVGPKKTSSVACRELICESSPFFEKALNGDFKEASNNEMELPEINAKIFDHFLQWLYTKSFDDHML